MCACLDWMPYSLTHSLACCSHSAYQNCIAWCEWPVRPGPSQQLPVGALLSLWPCSVDCSVALLCAAQLAAAAAAAALHLILTALRPLDQPAAGDPLGFPCWPMVLSFLAVIVRVCDSSPSVFRPASTVLALKYRSGDELGWPLADQCVRYYVTDVYLGV